MIEKRLSKYLVLNLIVIGVLLVVCHFFSIEKMPSILYYLAILPFTVVVQIFYYQVKEKNRIAIFSLMTMIGLLISFFIGGGHG